MKLPPAPKMEKKKKSWIDIAGNSIKNTVDGAFRNMAVAVGNKVCSYPTFALANHTSD